MIIKNLHALQHGGFCYAGSESEVFIKDRCKIIVCQIDLLAALGISGYLSRIEIECQTVRIKREVISRIVGLKRRQCHLKRSERLVKFEELTVGILFFESIFKYLIKPFLIADDSGERDELSGCDINVVADAHR